MLTVDANPDGTKTVTDFPSDADGGPAAAGVPNVVAPVAPVTITLTPYSSSLLSIYGSANIAVAVLKDPDPGLSAADFTATVDKGDGTSVAGQILSIGTGVYSIGAILSYDVPGSYTLTVKVAVPGGQTVTTLVPLEDLDGTGFASDGFTSPTITALEGISTGPVTVLTATITGPADAIAAARYVATINWGDGSPLDAATVNVSGTAITVIGSHLFTSEPTSSRVVTLEDLTGNTAAIDGSSNVRDDVSSRVSSFSSGLVYNPLTGLFSGTVTYTNKSAAAITGPIPVVFLGLPAGVTVANPTPAVSIGDAVAAFPLITDPVDTVTPGESRTIAVDFRDPSLVPMTDTLAFFDPPPPAAPATTSQQGVPRRPAQLRG